MEPIEIELENENGNILRITATYTIEAYPDEYYVEDHAIFDENGEPFSKEKEKELWEKYGDSICSQIDKHAERQMERTYEKEYDPEEAKC